MILELFVKVDLLTIKDKRYEELKRLEIKRLKKNAESKGVTEYEYGKRRKNSEYPYGKR